MRDHIGRTFANVRASISITDADEARAAATRVLLEQLARHLGLDASKVEIRVDAEAERRTAAQRARGLMAGGIVYLNPTRYDPRTYEGRFLLGHEVAHVAQRAALAPVRGRAHAVAERAEVEAHLIGHAFAVGAIPQPAMVSLPADRVAALDDDSAVTLKEIVVQSREREIQSIRHFLREVPRPKDGKLTTPHWAVEEILKVLAVMPFSVARAVVSALSAPERVYLVGSIAPAYFVSYRPQVLAAYAALQPQEFKSFDEELLAQMDFSLLAPEEQEAVVYTLRNLSEKNQQALLESDKRDAIGALMLAPALGAAELDKLSEKEQREKREELERGKEAAKGTDSFSQQDEAEAESILKIVTDRLTSFIVTDAKAVEALDALTRAKNNQPLMAFVARKMEAQGLLDKLIEELPTEERYRAKNRSETFLQLLSYRPPEKSIALAQSLLSYGVFDWAVRDDEARFAYHLIKQLPPAAQDRFRRLDNGKWFRRLQENIAPELIKSGEYVGIEVREKDGKLADVTVEYAQKIAADKGKSLTELIKECEQGINEKTAPTILGHIIAVGGATRERDADPMLLEAVVRRLDMLGYIEQLFDALKDADIYSEENRLRILRVMTARDPINVQYHARQLVERTTFLGISLTVVTAREAFLAYQLIRSLPDAEREAFIAKESTLWKDILGEMTSQMRTSKDLNAFVERDGGLNRAAVMGQLLEDKTWANTARLDGLIRMAIAMGEHKWVFEQSRLRYTPQMPTELRAIYDKYSLFDEQKPLAQDGPPDKSKIRRDKYQANDFKGTGFFEEGIFQTLGTVAKGIVFFFRGTNLILAQRSVGADVDLEQLQGVLGGDISGVKLAEVASGQKGGDKPKPGESAKEKETRELNAATNKLSVRLDVRRGVLEVRLPRLEIESANYHSGGMNFQAGKISLRGLVIRAAYATSSYEQPTSLWIDAPDVDLNDLLIVMRDSMYAVNRMKVGQLHLQGGATEEKIEIPPSPRKGEYIPIPILSKIIGLVYHAFKFKGLFTKSPTQEMREGFEMLRSLEISFGSLDVSGININGSQYIAELNVRDFNLTVNRPAYLRAHITSLTRRIEQRMLAANQPSGPQDTSTPAERLALAQTETAPLAAQLKKAKAELAVLEPEEQELVGLERLSQVDPKQLSPAQQQRLQELRAKMKAMKGGLAVTVGGVSVKGVEGTITTDDIELKNLSGQGELSAAGMESVSALIGPGIISDQTILRRFASDADPQTFKDQLNDADFRLEIGNISTKRLELMSGIPSAKELAEKKEQLEAKLRYDPEVAGEFFDVKEKLEKVKRYERFAARGIASLDKDEREEFRTLRASLLAEATIKTGPVNLEDAHLDVNLGKGQIALGGRRLTVGGVEMAGGSITAESVTGTDVSFGANLKKPGLAGLTGLPKSLDSGSISAGSLEVTGVRIAARKKNFEAQKEWLSSLIASGKYSKATTARYKARLDRITDYLDVLKTYEDGKKAAEEILSQADASTEARARAQADLDMYTTAIKQWETQLSLRSVSAQGLNAQVGNLSAVFQKGGLGTPGVTIKGKDGKPIFKSLTAKGVVSRDPLHPEKETHVEEVTLKSPNGKITYDGSSIRLEDFVLEEAAVSGLFIQGPDTQIETLTGGSVRLLKLKTNATISLSEPDKQKERIDEEGKIDIPPKMTVINVESLKIEEIAAQKVRYFKYKGDPQYTVDITAGSLLNIGAEQFKMELPEEGDIRYVGGKLTVETIKNVDFAGKLKDGLSASGRLNAKQLAVSFASDGTKTIDLASLGLTGGRLHRQENEKLSQEEIDLSINLHAKGLHVRLAEHEKSFHLGELTAEAKGKVGGGKVDASLSVADAGVGRVRETDEYIKVDNFHIGLITLNRLSFDSIVTSIETKGASPVSVRDLSVDLTVEKNTPPKGDKLKATKAKPGIKRVVIHKFRIPTINMRGIHFFTAAGGFSLDLPEGEPALIENTYLEPEAEGGEGFIIQPKAGGKGWELLGKAGIESLDFKQAKADLIGTLTATSNIKAKQLKIGFLKGDKRTFDLEKLNLNEIAAEAFGSKFTFLKKGAIDQQGVSRHGVDEPGIELTGIHAEAEEQDGKTVVTKASVEGIAIQGFVWRNESKSITVDVKRATLPKGFSYIKGGLTRVPSLNITDAYLKIDSFEKLTQGPSSGGGGLAPSNLDFLETLDGQVNCQLYLPIIITLSPGGIPDIVVDVRDIQPTFPIKLLITEGRLNFKVMEDTALGGPKGRLNEVLDFEVDSDDKKLRLEFDPRRLAAGYGLGPAIISLFARSDIFKWSLGTKAQPHPFKDKVNPSEVYQAKYDKLVKLTRLIKPDAPDKPPSSLVKTEIRMEEMQLSDFTKSSLSLKGYSEIKLQDDEKNYAGRIILGGKGKDGVQDLSIMGGTTTGRGIELGLNEANLAVEDLRLGGAKLNVGQIKIANVHDAFLKWAKGKPKGFEAMIESATAENIAVALPEKKEK